MIHHVLVSTSDAGVRDLICLILAEFGFAVDEIDVYDWLAGVGLPAATPDVLILDEWALREPEALRRAQARLAGQLSSVILLADGPAAAGAAEQLGAVTLPLLFELDDLITAMRQALTPLAAIARAA
jgi:hypothetical protein